MSLVQDILDFSTKIANFSSQFAKDCNGIIVNLFSHVVNIPTSVCTWLHKPNPTERRWNHLLKWAGGLFSNALFIYGVLAWNASVRNNELARLGIGLSLKDMCESNNLTLPDRITCDEHREALLLTNLVPQDIWQSSGSDGIWRHFGSRIPAGFYGTYCYVEQHRETCLGLAMVLLTLLMTNSNAVHKDVNFIAVSGHLAGIVVVIFLHDTVILVLALLLPPILHEIGFLVLSILPGDHLCATSGSPQDVRYPGLWQIKLALSPQYRPLTNQALLILLVMVGFKALGVGLQMHYLAGSESSRYPNDRIH